MATSIQIILDLRRQKSDKTYPISYRIIHNRSATTIRTGYSVEKEYWDGKSSVKRSCKNIADTVGLNFLLSKRKTELMRKIIDLDNQGILAGMTVSELKLFLTEKTKKKNDIIQVFGERIISELKNEGKYGNSDTYKQALSFLRNYSGKKNITFRQLTFQMLKMLENRYMANSDNHYNGLSVYMRSIRALFNRAIAEGIVKKEHYPFKQTKFDKNKYQIKSEPTKKRAVSKEVINRIEHFDNGNKYLRKFKYYFLFSFYTMGMNMVDMAKLRKRNIEDNTLYYKRSKTGRTYEIRLNQKAWDILQYFGYDKKKANDFLFPILENVTGPEKMRKKIQENVSRTNKHLKIIAAEIGLKDVKLTTYVSRHSWATIADRAGINRRLISQGLGHRNQQTTEIYIDDIESGDALADANDLITGE
jgi:integrase